MSRKAALARCVQKSYEWETRTDTTLSGVFGSEGQELDEFLDTVPDEYHSERTRPLLQKLTRQCEALKTAKPMPKKHGDDFGFSDEEEDEGGSAEATPLREDDPLTALQKRYVGLEKALRHIEGIDKEDVGTLSFLFAGKAVEDSINNNISLENALEKEAKQLRKSIRAERNLKQEHKKLTEMLQAKLRETRERSRKGPNYEKELLQAQLKEQSQLSGNDISSGLRFIKGTLARLIADSYLKKSTKITEGEYEDLVDIYGDRIKMLIDDLFYANLVADEESLAPDDEKRYIEYHKEDIPIVQFFLTSNFVVPYPKDGFKIKLKMQLEL
ncbi:hypothetical protein B0I72DRAFT_135687 [Yarrowia lipolytica]|jgi:hypothetical protein|uniref:YALI0E11935p n=2 Tax=Yarrowia lipolytica TaxID=4952 RepID=Q6C672_YARLI|nr:YALI0E11935p [Yarrowia lipolytica CLIB122]AOW05300.1 hypothetical protein YALI1_E14733g [Yarrowia lipolytica]KAB8283806.1 hypothetical protein BKA91DRAFT_136172 [Yarrowia lipolytica]KAE8172731.1 hypothetical protein BKA90DRAFT_136810 [Yarrowia lipolytica]KAJ8056819.1 hypothetical protein LXG23DRAFT_53528 [Yarrowia lipolytica]QNQ00206.1 Hypothetical protein YALI2_E01521g [Yarrowia lipolytica]|eukprot:XP_503840.1 YALI0E11935p [Yarrowia lipolytica CLIB122]